MREGERPSCLANVERRRALGFRQTRPSSTTSRLLHIAVLLTNHDPIGAFLWDSSVPALHLCIVGQGGGGLEQCHEVPGHVKRRLKLALRGSHRESHASGFPAGHGKQHEKRRDPRCSGLSDLSRGRSAFAARFRLAWHALGGGGFSFRLGLVQIPIAGRIGFCRS